MKGEGRGEVGVRSDEKDLHKLKKVIPRAGKVVDRKQRRCIRVVAIDVGPEALRENESVQRAKVRRS